MVVRNAKLEEAASLTALCVRSKAHWGYDAAFMKLSAAALAVNEDDIAASRVLVAVDDAGRVIGMACVLPEGETSDLDALFVDPPAIGSGAGRALFDAAVILARQQGARRMTILADPNSTDNTDLSVDDEAAMRRISALPIPQIALIRFIWYL